MAIGSRAFACYMVDNQNSRSSTRGNFRQLSSGCMVFGSVSLPVGHAGNSAGWRIYLVNQNVAFLAPFAVPHHKCPHRDLVVLINNPRLDIMAANIQGRPAFSASRADFDVAMPRGEYMAGHLFCAFRPIDIQLFAPHDPRGQNEIRKPGGMIRMQMSNKRDGNLCRIQRGRSLSCGSRCTAHNTRAEVYEVCFVSHPALSWGPRSVGERAGRSCAKKNDFGSRLTGQWHTQKECNCQAREREAEKTGELQQTHRYSPGADCTGSLSLSHLVNRNYLVLR